MNFIRKAWNKAFKPKPKLKVSEWADTYRIIPAGTSSEAGPWRTMRVPYLREPMDSISNPDNEIIVLCCSSQVGKSELMLNAIGYYIDQEPAPQLLVQPTQDAVENFSKQRIAPMLEASPRLAALMPHAIDKTRTTAKKTENTIRQKYFAGGYLAMEGANSPTGLASRPIRVLLADEVDRYPQTSEGDPLRLAIQRTTNFHNRKIIMASSPTLKGFSRIDEWYEKSDMRKYFIPCQYCGFQSEWNWSMVKWDKDPEGQLLTKTIRMECPNCGKKIRGSGRPDMAVIASGFWRATRQGTEGVVGYHFNSLISPWVTLESLVVEFTAAVHTRDKHGLQEFINLKLGEAFEDEAMDEDISNSIMARREMYAGESLPKESLIVTAGCDVQRDRIEATVTAWGRGKECWVLSHNILFGNPLEMAVWSELDILLGKLYNHPLYGRMAVSCATIDSGDGTTAEAVYAYCKQREASRIFAIKGRGGFDLPITSRPSKNNRFNAYLFTLGVDSLKKVTLQRLSITEAGPAYIHIPKNPELGCDEEYCLQLGAEKLITKFERGRATQKWKKIRERNEALDCMGYAYAALQILGVDLDTLAHWYENKGGTDMNVRTKKSRVMSHGVNL